MSKQKVVMLYGSRRTGKTTIVDNLIEKYGKQTLFLLGEDMQVAELLNVRTVTNYKQLIGEKKIVIIDEAQVLPDIGKILKLMIDTVKGITIIVTGSSSFDLIYSTGEPLVGRNIIFQLWPITQAELSSLESRVETRQNLDERLIYGSYPELWHLNHPNEKAEYLKQLINSYLLKDLLIYGNIKGADVMYKLLKLLAWQIGSQVSTVELGNSLQLNKETVERYLDLLSKVFIIYPLHGFSRNLRKEVTKSKKWYFYDNGVRNALIQNFSPLIQRNDVGMLWEQYMLGERQKFNISRNHHPSYYFWRTYDHQEIDLIEVDNNKQIQALEFKWKSDQKKAPSAFSKAYPDAQFQVIDPTNYLDWII